MGINNKTLLNKLTLISVLMMQNSYCTVAIWKRATHSQHETLFTQELTQLGCWVVLRDWHIYTQQQRHNQSEFLIKIKDQAFKKTYTQTVVMSNVLRNAIHLII